LATVAEFETDLVRSRTREGMQVAKAKGHLRGKPPNLTVKQAEHLVEPANLGTHTTAELAEPFGVVHSTIYAPCCLPIGTVKPTRRFTPSGH
jgi:DNA invertase Pin-like site-specific DNA recombinase